MDSTLLIDQLLEIIDVVYILVCNAATYFIITFFESVNGKMTLLTWTKRLLSAAVAFILGSVFVEMFGHDLESIVVGFFVQFLVYDYLLKPTIKMLQQKLGVEEDTVDLDGTTLDEDKSSHVSE